MRAQQVLLYVIVGCLVSIKGDTVSKPSGVYPFVSLFCFIHAVFIALGWSS